MRLWLVALALAAGCSARPLDGESGLVTGPLDLSVPEPADLAATAPADAGPDGDGDGGVVAPPPPPSCGFTAGSAVAAPTFAASTVAAGEYVMSIGVGDLDGDGFADLVTANRNDFYPPPAGDLETISVILSSGGGSFQAQTKYLAPLYPQQVALGDVDHDGLVDVVADTGQALSIFRNGGGGKLGSPSRYTDDSRGAPTLALLDVDGDGALDLVTSAFGSGALELRRGRGDGSFGDPWSLPGAQAAYLAGGDFDGDGRGDVAFASQATNTIAIALGRADGTLAPARTWSIPPPAYPVGFAVGDVDGDGRLDVVVSTYASTSTGSVAVALGDGHGGLGCVQTYLVDGTPQAIAIADFDGDGRRDLIVTDTFADRLFFFAGVGNGALAPASLLTTTIAYPVSISSGDFDRDGKVDVAIGSSSNASVTLLYNRTP